MATTYEAVTECIEAIASTRLDQAERRRRALLAGPAMAYVLWQRDAPFTTDALFKDLVLDGVVPNGWLLDQVCVDRKGGMRRPALGSNPHDAPAPLEIRGLYLGESGRLVGVTRDMWTGELETDILDYRRLEYHDRTAANANPRYAIDSSGSSVFRTGAVVASFGEFLVPHNDLGIRHNLSCAGLGKAFVTELNKLDALSAGSVPLVIPQ